MTDWKAVLDADFAAPHGAPIEALVAELETMLLDPDPEVRDGLAYPILATWVQRRQPGLDVIGLGDRMADRLRHPQIQARTFATLILAWVVGVDAGDRAAVLRWRDAFAEWWPSEQDLRGYEEKLGWLHAAAHGADTLGAFGRSLSLADPDLQGLLELAATRLLAPTEHLFSQMEDDRIAQGVYAVLTRARLTDPTGWLTPIAGAFRDGSVGPLPAAHANAMRTIRCLYLLLDQGARLSPDGPVVPVPHRDAVRQAIARTIAIRWPLLAV